MDFGMRSRGVFDGAKLVRLALVRAPVMAHDYPKLVSESSTKALTPFPKRAEAAERFCCLGINTFS